MSASDLTALSLFRLRRPWLFGSIFVVCLAAVGWSIFWGVAATQTLAVLDAWMRHEAETGRSWSCAERHLGGFPVNIEITCVDPHFQGFILGKSLNGSLTSLRAASRVMNPREVTAVLLAPFRAKTEDASFSLDLQWSAMRIVLSGDPEAFEEGELRTSGLTVAGISPDAGPFAGSIMQFDGRVIRLAKRQDHAYGFFLKLKGATNPAFDLLFGTDHPADLEFKGTLTQADFADLGAPFDLIEDWRRGQGQINLDSACLTQADIRLEARGSLGLDPGHRLQGKLEADLTGFDPVLRRFGINPILLDAGSLLNNLLGKRTASVGERKTLHVPLTFDKGWLAIGPLRTPIALQPLY